jgi:branched-chain amino acid transport system permease protein
MTAAVSTGRSFRHPFAGMDRKRRDTIIVIGLFILAIVYPIIYPQFLQRGTLSFLPWPPPLVLVQCCIFAILALGLNIVMGFAGLLDLGYVAFYAIGAYTTAFLASPFYGIHISWWIVVWLAVAVAAIFGIFLGAPTLKLRGDYLAIVTLGFGEIVPIVFRNLGDFTFGLPAFLGGAILIGPNANLTGGPVGINPIDPPTLPIPGPWGDEIVFSNQQVVFSLYLIIGLLALTFFICTRLRDSKLGRAWMAIREDETAAAAMGINTVTTKLLAFALGASFSGFAGAFTGAFNTAIFPESFRFQTSILIVVMIILGGIGSLRGVVIGAFAVAYVNYFFLEWAKRYVDPPIQAIGDATGIAIFEQFTLTSYNFLIFGIILAVMMVKRPEGLFPVEHAKAEMHGIGISAEVTGGGSDELALAEEEAVEAELAAEADYAAETGIVDLPHGEGEPDPTSAAGAALMADTPPDQIRDRDLPEDTR